VENSDGRNYGRFEDEPLDGVPFGYVGKIIKWVDEEPSVPLEWIRNAILPRFLKDDDRETALYGGNGLADENPVPYLRSMHIPRNHLANTYFKKRHAMGFLSLAWDLGVIAISTSISTGDDISKFLSSPGTEALGWGFYKSKVQELQHRGYTILENFGDPNNFHDGQLDMKEYGLLSNTMDFRNLWKTANQSLEQYMKDSNVHLGDNRKDALWSSIFNHAISTEDGKDRGSGRFRYSSTRTFVMDYLATKDMVKWSKVRAALDMWLGCLAALLNISDNRRYQIWTPKTGGRWLATGRDCPAQTGHNDFSHSRGQDVGYFCITTGKDGASLWICESSHKYVFYPEGPKFELSKLLRLEKIAIPPYSVLFGHGYVQHAGAEWSGTANLRYHMYFIPENHDLMDDVSFAYGWSLSKNGYKGSNVSPSASGSKTAQEVINEIPEAVSDDEQERRADDDEQGTIRAGSVVILDE